MDKSSRAYNDTDGVVLSWFRYTFADRLTEMCRSNLLCSHYNYYSLTFNHQSTLKQSRIVTFGFAFFLIFDLFMYAISECSTCFRILFPSLRLVSVCYFRVFDLFPYAIPESSTCFRMLFPSLRLVSICYFRIFDLFLYAISESSICFCMLFPNLRLVPVCYFFYREHQI